MNLWARPGKPPDISSLWLRANLGLRGPVVSVGPAEPTDLLLVLIRVHSSAVRGYNVFTLSAPARSGPSPSTWSLPDFCLFLSTFLSLPFLLLSAFLLSSLFFNHLFASLSLPSSQLAFPGPPSLWLWLQDSYYKGCLLPCLSLASVLYLYHTSSVSPLPVFPARAVSFFRIATLYGSMPGSCPGLAMGTAMGTH